MRWGKVFQRKAALEEAMLWAAVRAYAERQPYVMINLNAMEAALKAAAKAKP